MNANYLALQTNSVAFKPHITCALCSRERVAMPNFLSRDKAKWRGKTSTCIKKLIPASFLYNNGRIVGAKKEENIMIRFLSRMITDACVSLGYKYSEINKAINTEQYTV